MSRKDIIDKCLVQTPNGRVLNPDSLFALHDEYLNDIHDITKRNIISYYSGFLTHPTVRNSSICDNDLNFIMDVIKGMKEKDKGLDLILHTPGGATAATEQIIKYLYAIFDDNIRVIIPQMAMSAGSMISLSCKEIIMGKQSFLGPFDPQYGGVACQSVLKEFDQAVDDIKTRPESKILWQKIIQYGPTFLFSRKQSIAMTEEMMTKFLEKHYEKDCVKKIMKKFFDNDISKEHSRHISKDEAKEVGLNIKDLEENQSLQDAVLNFHHANLIAFENTPIIKIVANHQRTRNIEVIRQ